MQARISGTVFGTRRREVSGKTYVDVMLEQDSNSDFIKTFFELNEKTPFGPDDFAPGSVLDFEVTIWSSRFGDLQVKILRLVPEDERAQALYPAPIPA